jgi:hypothetical protein
MLVHAWPGSAITEFNSYLSLPVEVMDLDVHLDSKSHGQGGRITDARN